MKIIYLLLSLSLLFCLQACNKSELISLNPNRVYNPQQVDPEPQPNDSLIALLDFLGGKYVGEIVSNSDSEPLSSMAGYNYSINTDTTNYPIFKEQYIQVWDELQIVFELGYYSQFSSSRRTVTYLFETGQLTDESYSTFNDNNSFFGSTFTGRKASVRQNDNYKKLDLH